MFIQKIFSLFIQDLTRWFNSKVNIKLKDTEEKILAAAEKIFVQQGYDGARMQVIADEAEINKALLHYYFRSKDKLFQQIVRKKFSTFFPKAKGILEGDGSVIDKICNFAERYIGFLAENPYLPLFIFNTVNRDPDFMNEFPIEMPRMFMMEYMQAVEQGLCREYPPAQLMMTITGMCIFPFVARPMILKLLDLSSDDFYELMQQRTQEVRHQIRALLTV